MRVYTTAPAILKAKKITSINIYEKRLSRHFHFSYRTQSRLMTITNDNVNNDNPRRRNNDFNSNNNTIFIGSLSYYIIQHAYEYRGVIKFKQILSPI